MKLSCFPHLRGTLPDVELKMRVRAAWASAIWSSSAMTDRCSSERGVLLERKFEVPMLNLGSAQLTAVQVLDQRSGTRSVHGVSRIRPPGNTPLCSGSRYRYAAACSTWTAY